MNKLYQVLCNVYVAISGIYDRRLATGVDFARWMTRDELNLTADTGNQYQPSPFELDRLLKKFPMNTDQPVLDVGCGKGRAMYTFACNGYKKVNGIDLSKELTQTANSNFALLDTPQCRAVTCNALDYEGYADHDIFYFYNPVPAAIFERTFEKINRSHKGGGQEATIVCMNPTYESVILENTMWQLVKVQKSIVPWFELRVYQRKNSCQETAVPDAAQSDAV